MVVLRRLVWRFRVVTIGALAAGMFFLAADSLVRQTLARSGLRAHLISALGLYTAAAVMLGSAVWLGLSAVSGIASVAARRSPRAARLLTMVLHGALGALVMAPNVLGIFGGRAAARSPLGSTLPYFVAVGVGFGVALGALVVERAVAAIVSGHARAGWRFIGLFAVVALALIGVDLTAYVGLYSRAHTLLELAAAWLLMIATSLAWILVSGDAPGATVVTRRRPKLVRGAAAVCVAAATFAVVLAASPSLRHWQEAALRSASREPVYLGRLLRRMNRLEAMAQPPSTRPRVRIEELAEAYDIAATTRDPLWDLPPRTPAPSAARRDLPSSALRDGKGYNVLVYYVDTLRQDVAYDPEIMPNVAKFASESLAFERAYSPGSDTRRALPGLVTGRYGFPWSHEASLLTRTKDLGVRSTLFIGESAYEFLNKLVPEFSFDDTLRFPDYTQGGVWGYGANLPTSARVVDHAIDWLGQRGESRFMAWIFNFDVHGWRELDRDYVYGAADRYQVPDEGRYNWRYRVVARAVDAEFGRLMTALDELGLASTTIVVFVSDHGEGLGYRDFWVHSTFLWEPLVRVPLLLRVPGVAPAKIDQVVSLVDVAPTLVGLLDPKARVTGYHGEDLLLRIQRKAPPRRAPILLSAASDESMTRVGIVGDRYKLVLPVEWGEPELYDLRAPDPDAVDVAQDQPSQVVRFLSQLLRSPVLRER